MWEISDELRVRLRKSTVPELLRTVDDTITTLSIRS
jgi:hypothetical protein